MTGDTSVRFGASATGTNRIQAFEADGFELGSDSAVNLITETYHYIAFKTISGWMDVGSYTGNGSNNRNFTGLGFQPQWVVIKSTGGDLAVHRPDSLSGDSTQYFNNSANFSNGIQSLDTDGFQLGTHSTVNTNSTTYHWASFGDGTGGGGGTASSGGFTWFTDAIDVSPGTTGSWQDIDLSAIVPTGATGVIVEFDNTNDSIYQAVVRGKEDTRNYMSNASYNTIKEKRSRFQIVKLDSNRLIEGWISNANVDIWLRGYTAGGDPSYFDLPPDITPSSGSWQTVDVTSNVDAGADGVILLIASQSGSSQTYAIREVGSTDQPGGDTISVTELVFSLSSITGLSGAGVEIVEDDNSDGTIGGGETTTVGGSGTVDQGGGTITFTTSFNVTAVTNYILRADFASLADADAVTIDLTAANITASATISGNTTSAVHTESSGGGGGGGGAQSFYYLETPVDVTPGVSASWETVDLSSQVPDGATGCIIRFNNLNNSDMDIGLRKPGSSDNHTLFIYPNAQLWAMSGVDSNRYVEVYLENVANVEVWITGYTTAGVTFFTNGKDKSLGSTGTWQDIDISADTAADTAVGVIVEVNGAYQQDFGVRMNGSSDEIYRSGRHSWAIIGVDGSEIFEGKISDTNIDFFVVGYITDGATFFTNALDKSLASTGAWTDIDISADTGTDSASGAFIEVVQMGSPDVDHGFRKKGTSQDMIGRAGSTDSAHMWAVVELDSSVRG